MKKSVFILYALIQTCGLKAQEIPLGEWRLHPSFNKIVALADAGSLFYAAAPSALMMLDKQELSVRTITKLEGLSSSGITALAFDAPRQQLLIAYEDGDLDILKSNQIINYNSLKNSALVTGSKKINHMTTGGPYAYLSTDYGVVVFDLVRLEVKETWRDLGSTGTNLPIFQSVIKNDSIYLATQKGIMAGKLSDNLLDFTQWQRYDAGDFNTPVKTIAVFNNRMYTALNSKGIYRLANNTWSIQPFLAGLQYTQITSGSDLYVLESTRIWRITSDNSVDQIIEPLVTTPLTLLESSEKIFIGDTFKGLITNVQEPFESFKANGPSQQIIRKLYDGDRLYALTGGYSASFLPLNNLGDVNVFSNGQWATQTYGARDFTDAKNIGSNYYFSSFGYGLLQVQETTETLYDETNSPLQNLSPPAKNVFISTLEMNSEGLWVVNYGSSAPLKLLKSDNTWEVFAPSALNARYALDIAIDFTNKIWLCVNPSLGGGLIMFDRASGQTRTYSTSSGNGSLPNAAVNTVAVDRDGLVWIGTDQGAAYFFSSNQDAVRPIFGNGFLLRDEDVTDIEVDGGNRKWMGTERGVWLFNATGEQLIHNFNTTNSPLPSDVILDLEINGTTGEVFIATDKGLASFRADATTGSSVFSEVKIFPNPVTADFSGLVGISGLATDATLKITDISGKLMRQLNANGGSASWDVRDLQGRKVPTGIYLIFSSSVDGIESFVGKVAVIH